MRFWAITLIAALLGGIFTHLYLQKKKLNDRQSEQMSQLKFQELMVDVAREKELKAIFYKLPEEKYQQLEQIAKNICSCTDSLENSPIEVSQKLDELSEAIKSSTKQEEILEAITQLTPLFQSFDKFLSCSGMNEEITKWPEWKSIQPDIEEDKIYILTMELIAYRCPCRSGKSMLNSLSVMMSAMFKMMLEMNPDKK